MTGEQLQLASLPINDMGDVVKARRHGLDMALTLGFSRPDATKIAVVISELGRNITLYTEGGTITLTACDKAKKYLTITAQDQGPGIEDVELALAGGYSTSKGLGLGLSGSRRLMDEFEIQSVIGAGTLIKATKWLQRST